MVKWLSWLFSLFGWWLFWRKKETNEKGLSNSFAFKQKQQIKANEVLTSLNSSNTGKVFAQLVAQQGCIFVTIIRRCSPSSLRFEVSGTALKTKLPDVWAMAICMFDRVYIRLSLAFNAAALISATQQDMFLNSEVSSAIYSHEMWGKKKRTAWFPPLNEASVASLS